MKRVVTVGAWGMSEAEERVDESDGVLILIVPKQPVSPETYAFPLL